jgi:hypothetical protein
MEDYRVADEILRRHATIVRKNNRRARIVYLQGNHEYRAERFCEANPACTGLLEAENVLHLKERNIEWVPSWSEGAVFRLGPKLVFSHGIYCNDHHAKKTAQRFGAVSVLYGHTHDIQVFSSHGLGTGNTITAASLGCLCLPQPYLRGAPTRWQQAVTVVEVLMPSGDFTFSVIRINDHRFVVNGKVYAG